VVAQAYWLAAVAERCLGSPDGPLDDSVAVQDSVWPVGLFPV
jgi:hypothetical protein